MKVYFGLVARTAPIKESGELIKVDWSSKNIEAKVRIYPQNPDIHKDPNPRGGARGCRGIDIIDNKVIAADYHTLNIYNEDLIKQKSFSHGLMVGLHEIFCEPHNKVWVSSTSIDAVLLYDIFKETLLKQYHPREMEKFQKIFNLVPLEIDKSSDNRLKFLDLTHINHPSHLHLNTVIRYKGDILTIFNSFGSVVNLSKEEILIKDPLLRGIHDMKITDEGYLFYNGTFLNSVFIYDIKKLEPVKKIDLLSFEWVKSLKKKYSKNYSINQKIRERLATIKTILKIYNKYYLKIPFRKIDSKIAKPIFVRGIDLVGDYLFVGISPASILCIDWRNEELVDFFQYSKDVRDAIYGLKVIK